MGRRPRSTTPVASAALLLTLALLAVGTESGAQEASPTTVEVAVGANVTSGRYGLADRTTLVDLPLSVEAQHGDFRVSASLPYLWIEGPFFVLPNTDGGAPRPPAPPRDDDGMGSPGEPPPPPPPESDTIVDTRDGIGDVDLIFTYLVPPIGDRWPYVDLGVRLKLPTASRGDFLGTGEIDVRPQVDLVLPLGDLMAIAGLGYQINGDGSGVDYRDTLSVYGGFLAQVGAELSLGLSYEWQQSASRVFDSTHELLPFASWDPWPDWTVSAYGDVGLSEGAPDYGGGLRLGRRFRL